MLSGGAFEWQLRHIMRWGRWSTTDRGRSSGDAVVTQTSENCTADVWHWQRCKLFPSIVQLGHVNVTEGKKKDEYTLPWFLDGDRLAKIYGHCWKSNSTPVNLPSLKEMHLKWGKIQLPKVAKPYGLLYGVGQIIYWSLPEPYLLSFSTNHSQTRQL